MKIFTTFLLPHSQNILKSISNENHIKKMDHRMWKYTHTTQYQRSDTSDKEGETLEFKSIEACMLYGTE